MAKFRWQDVVNIVVGVCVALSPWVLGYAEELPSATWSAVVAGVIVIAVAAIDLDVPGAWEEWIAMLAGLWLVISPFALGFTEHTNALVSALAGGIVIMVFAAWALWGTRPTQSASNRRDQGHHYGDVG